MKTKYGRVIELQHSYLRAEGRRAREAFYGPKMIWVVDGLRNKRDKSNFYEALERSTIVSLKPLKFAVRFEACSILRLWADSGVGVVFDFGDTDNYCFKAPYCFKVPVLWYLAPGSQNGLALLFPMYREEFVKRLLTGSELAGISAKIVPPTPPRRRSAGFQQYPSRKRRRRPQTFARGPRKRM